MAPLTPLDADALKAELLDVVRRGATQRPRDQQKTIGPSGLGEPCLLALGYGVLQWNKANTDSDPLPSIVGTGAHEMFAGFVERNQQTLPDGRPRWLVEQRVWPRHDIPGSCDLFDRLAGGGTVLDYKFLGKTKLDQLKRGARDGLRAAGPKYRVQAHTYGLGLVNAGEQVRHVAVLAVPRGGFLNGAVLLTEPYDRQVALDALRRKDDVVALLAGLEVEDRPERWRLVPRQPGPGCTYCPWFRPYSQDLSVGCPGHLSERPAPAPTAAEFLGVHA